MIISDKNQLAFLHIPKCAGTSVRTPLSQLDDRQGFYTSRVDQHEALGLLDYVHMPLFTLQDYFHRDFQCIKHYWSFTVIRDPFFRFPSSLSQRLKMYGEKPIQHLTQTEIKHEIDKTIRFLLRQPNYNHQLPPGYIHFQKQVDYIRVDGEQIVNTLYTVDKVEKLLNDVSKQIGRDLRERDYTPKPANQSVVHRNEAIRLLLESTRPISRNLSKALPKATKAKLRSLIYVAPTKRLDYIFNSDYIRDFVYEYYKEDIELWSQLTSAP